MAVRRGIHNDITGKNVDTPISWTYADQTAREAATGFVPIDVGRFAWQLDDDSIWMLKDDSPIAWVAIGSGTSGAASAAEKIYASTNFR